jgi:hypothetical protein
VSSRRKPGTGKDLKDLGQAEQLVEALGETGRHDDLLAAFEEARERGSAWREAIEKSLTRMKALGMTKIATALTGQMRYPTRTVRVGYFVLPTTSMGVRVLANCAMVMTAASVGNSLLVPSVALMIISRVAAFSVVLDFMQMTDTSPKFAQSLAQDLPRRR